nr:hypothetical protein [Allomuricauda sp.]
MNDQCTEIGAERQRRLTKIVKKPSKKELLTLDKVKKMNFTKLSFATFQRNARRYFFTQRLGTRLVLSHPYTDVHGRHLKSVVLDFCVHKKTGYVHVQPFHPVDTNTYGVSEAAYSFSLFAETHKSLYKKLLTHKLL